MSAETELEARDRLSVEVLRRTGVRLSTDDPVFTVVELARLAFEEALQVAHARSSPVADAIDSAARKAAGEITRAALGSISTDTRLAREALATDLRQSLGELRLETAQARTHFNTTLATWMRGHEAAARVRYRALAFATALVLATGSFGVGVWVGRHASMEMTR